MAIDKPQAAVVLRSRFDRTAPPDPARRVAYASLIDALRHLQDAVASAAPGAATISEAATRVEELAALLDTHAVEESGRFFNKLPEVPGYGQAFTPPFTITDIGEGSIEAVVTFTRFNLGGGAAAHGGAVALVFDSLLGRLANSASNSRVRTVHLGVDYRRITPLDRELALAARIEKVEGRKHYLEGTLSYDGQVCAQALGLFLELLPGQQ